MEALALGKQKLQVKSSRKFFGHRFGLQLKELCIRLLLVCHNIRAFDVKYIWTFGLFVSPWISHFTVNQQF